MLLKCSKDAPSIADEPFSNVVVGSEQIERISPSDFNTSEGRLPALRFYLDGGDEVTWLFLSINDRNDELDRIIDLTNAAGGGGGTPTPPTGELPKLQLPVRLVSKADTYLATDDYLVIIDNGGGSKQVTASLPKPDASMNGQIFVIKLANDPEGAANSSAQVVGTEGALIDGSSSVSLTTAQASVTLQVFNGNYWITNRI